MSNYTLNAGAPIQEDTALLEPLYIAVGLVVFGLVFFWCHSPFSLQRKGRDSISV